LVNDAATGGRRDAEKGRNDAGKGKREETGRPHFFCLRVFASSPHPFAVSPRLPFNASPCRFYFLSVHLGMGKIISLLARWKGHTV
jgi:hypothetical protein